MTAETAETAETAWQAALDNEHAAIYGYAIVGGRLGPADTSAQASLSLHLERRDFCVERLIALGVEPHPAAAAYEPEIRVRSEADARGLAAEIEADSTVAYLQVLGATTTSDRRAATSWLIESTLEQTRWSGRVPALPGWSD